MHSFHLPIRMKHSQAIWPSAFYHAYVTALTFTATNDSITICSKWLELCSSGIIFSPHACLVQTHWSNAGVHAAPWHTTLCFSYIGEVDETQHSEAIPLATNAIAFYPPTKSKCGKWQFARWRGVTVSHEPALHWLGKLLVCVDHTASPEAPNLGGPIVVRRWWDPVHFMRRPNRSCCYSDIRKCATSRHS